MRTPYNGKGAAAPATGYWLFQVASYVTLDFIWVLVTNDPLYAGWANPASYPGPPIMGATASGASNLAGAFVLFVTAGYTYDIRTGNTNLEVDSTIGEIQSGV